MSAGGWRFKAATGLRLIGHAALLTWAVTVFYQPLTVILGAELKTAARSLGLESWLEAQRTRGFLINATSVPPGGTLLIDGVSRGTTPVMSNVACSEGKPIHLAVEKEGFPTWERSVLCREGETLLVRARLAP